MEKEQLASIERAEEAALNVLLNNSRGPYLALPRTAGWGYPEPYTRDLMISSLGILTSGNVRLIKKLRRVLETLAKNQSRLGHIPGLVHDPEDRGSSDTTPLFILVTGFFRKVTGETDFLQDAVQKAMLWMDYQSPDDRVIVAHLPTSTWLDEQWVLGYGLYVNTIVYSYLKLYQEFDKARYLENMMDKFKVTNGVMHRHVHEGLALHNKPYYAAWTYKVHGDERFDLMGNSLAILSGLASPSRSKRMISWIEQECQALREHGQLALQLPPHHFPYIRPEDPDWHPRYKKFCPPGEYCNGGVWPFVCGFYIAALVSAGAYQLAEEKLVNLTDLVRPARDHEVDYGFNEWFRAQDGTPRGEDWQTWSAAMYLYAAATVRQRKTPFFDEIRIKVHPDLE